MQSDFFTFIKRGITVAGKCVLFIMTEVTPFIEQFFQAGPYAMKSYFYCLKGDLKDIGNFPVPESADFTQEYNRAIFTGELINILLDTLAHFLPDKLLVNRAFFLACPDIYILNIRILFKGRLLSCRRKG